MNIGEHRTHPAADLFPLLVGAELAELVADIKAHGLRQPIVLSHDGRVLDGRNRYLACLEAGALPRFATFDGQDEWAFVVSANLRRRHLDASQRAMLATKISVEAKQELTAEAEKRKAAGRIAGAHAPKSGKKLGGNRSSTDSRAPQTRDHVAAAFGVNPRYVQDAEAIAAADPGLAAQVERGEKTIPQAKQEIAARPGRRKLNGHAKPSRPTGAGKPRTDRATPRPSDLGCNGFELTVHACGERLHLQEMLTKFDALIAPLCAADLGHLRLALRAFAKRIDAHVHPDA